MMGGRKRFPPFKGGGGAQQVLPCLEGGGGAKSFGPVIFNFLAPLPIISDRSLMRYHQQMIQKAFWDWFQR